MQRRKAGQVLRVGIADFSDAFWYLPLRPDERRFFAAKFRGRIYIFLRAAQGSRGAPLAWGRASAFVSRLGQAATTRS